MTELQGCLIFFLLYLLFGEFGVQFVESECLCVCVCVHLCVSARQERTCITDIVGKNITRRTEKPGCCSEAGNAAQYKRQMVP